MQTIAPGKRPGEKLRLIRRRLGLTTRDVSRLSSNVAASQSSEEFAISHARLVQVENERSVPGIFKLYTLSAIYGVTIHELLSAYLDLPSIGSLHLSMPFDKTHRSTLYELPVEGSHGSPVRIKAEALPAETSMLSRMLEAWADVPVAALSDLSPKNRRYGFIGLADRTMYPLIPPGAVVQIAESRAKPKPGVYRSEYDRPIYFIETRAGFICSWCEVNGDRLISIPHPMSACRIREFAYPEEAEIAGRVIGLALRLAPPEQAAAVDGSRERKAFPETMLAVRGAVAC